MGSKVEEELIVKHLCNVYAMFMFNIKKKLKDAFLILPLNSLVNMFIFMKLNEFLKICRYTYWILWGQGRFMGSENQKYFCIKMLSWEYRNLIIFLLLDLRRRNGRMERTILKIKFVTKNRKINNFLFVFKIFNRFAQRWGKRQNNY